MKIVPSSTQSTGYCNTMGTATTMNSLTEALGMSLPGSAAIPAPYRERQEDRIPHWPADRRDGADRPQALGILTREAFLNAIRVSSAIGGSTNAPIHLNAIARHAGVAAPLEDWQRHGFEVPLLVNLQPAGEYLGEDYFRAGGVPAVVAELMRHGMIHESAVTANGRRSVRTARHRQSRTSASSGGSRIRREARCRIHGDAGQSLRRPRS